MSKKYTSKDDGSMKGLTPYKKVEWIWNYYKIPIIAVIVGIIAIVSYIHSLSKINNDAIGVIMSDIYTADSSQSSDILNTGFDQFIGSDSNGKAPLELDHSISFTDNSIGGPANVQKLAAIVASHGAQVMLAPVDTINRFAPEDMFENLETYLPADLFEELKSKDLLVTATLPAVDEGSVQIPAQSIYSGIKIGKMDCSILEDAGYYIEEDTTLSFIVIAEKQERSINFLRYLMKIPYDSEEIEE